VPVLKLKSQKFTKQVILRLWKYLIREKSLLFFIVILLLINTGATLAGSYLLRPIINNYILPHNIPGLIRMILLLLSIYVIGSLAAIWQNRLMISCSSENSQSDPV
jgi:ATP-binding cassette subfamily B multidrug efflux pump